MPDEEYYEDEYYDELESSLDSTQEDHEEELLGVIGGATLLVATSLLIGNSNAVGTIMASEGFAPSAVSGMVDKILPNDLGYLNNGRNMGETSAQYGYHEGLLMGQLLIFQAPQVEGYLLGIPWTTCEDNGNCAGPNPVCDECQGLSGQVFPADGFEESAHPWCRCNEPLAEPVIMDRWIV